MIPWASLPSATKAAKKICFVEDAAFVELARVTSERGHHVFFARFEGSWSPSTLATIVVPAYQKTASRFGAQFDRSLSLYQSLKSRELDVIVFPSHGGLAYMCEEAKRAGLAFANTALVVRLDVAMPAGDSYSELVTRFMTRQSVSLADSVFTTVADRSVLAAMRFYQRVTAWVMEDGNTENKALSLIESLVLGKAEAAVPAEVAVTPLVTCIVTSFNRPEMLRQAVQSLQQQTYRVLEIIVVDDGSTAAGMKAVLAELEAQQVRVVRQSNQYLGAARNNGARLAQGEFLLFLDDDNIALPSMVATLVKAAQHSKAVVAVNAHYTWVDETAAAAVPADLSGLPVWCPVGPAIEAGLKGNVFGNANFLIAKNTFFALSGFSEDRAGWEDYEFHAKTAIAGVEYVTVPEPLMLYRQHSQLQMAKTTDSSVNMQRAMRPYTTLLQEASQAADMSLRDLDERIPTQCSITAVGFAQTQTVSGQTVGLCSSAQFSIVVLDNGGADYLGTSTTPIKPSISIGAAVVPDANLQYAAYVITPGVTTRTNWVISLQGTPPNIAFTSQAFAVTASVTSATGGTIVCTGVSQSPYCQVPTVCFHKDSTISYKGESMTLAQLRGHAECAVPHEVVADGVRIETACSAQRALRLTADHLVFTARGLAAAGSVRVGDVVFGDEEQRVPCKVTRVTGERQQSYFGLNCLRSVVLADGVKTSTFGSLHTLPSLWMKWVGAAAGIERASRWGDNIVSFVRSF